jgi:hypothetical protein
MNGSGLPAVFRECQRLLDQVGAAAAMDHLDRNTDVRHERDPLFWQWKGSLLLHGGRPQEAEAVLRVALTRREWPMGDPGIARILCEALLHLRRFGEVEAVSEPWAKSGDIDCMVLRWQAMLALGRPSEVAREAKALSERNVTVPGPHIAYLEALLDLGGHRIGSEHRVEVDRVLGILQAMKACGIALNAHDEQRLVDLSKRAEGSFGFGRGR